MNKVENITVVGSNTNLTSKIVGKVSWSPIPGLLYIAVPENVQDEYVTVLKLKLDSPLKLYSGHGGLQ
jgi:alpha-L-fucosidase